MLRGTRLWHYRENKRRTPPTITSVAPAAPAYGVAYSHSYTATGSIPITWSVTAGTLPTGLSLDSGTGALTGTPTAIGAFSWTVTATNAGGTADQAATATITYAEKVLFYGPVAYWKLDETSGTNAADSSGNGHDSIYDGVTLNATTAHDGGAAGVWDGINDGVNAYSAGMASAWPKAAGTISVWLKVASEVWVDGENRTVFRAFDTIDTGFLDIVKSAAGNSLAFILGAQSVIAAITPDSGWINVVVTWDQSVDQGRLYWNGTLLPAFNLNYTSTWSANPRVIYIGTRGASRFFSGSIAHVATYNGVLDAATILALATP